MRKKHGEATHDGPVELSGAVLVLPGVPLPEAVAHVTTFAPVTSPAPMTAPAVAAVVGSSLATLPAPVGAPVVPVATPVTAPVENTYIPQHRAAKRSAHSRSRLAVMALGAIALGGGAYYYLTAILPTMTG